MPSFSPVQSRPIALTASVESQVYGLFALAMALTVVGVFAGVEMAGMLLTSGTHLLLLFLELGIIFTASWWMTKTPLNYLLFGLFPFLSGVTITPYILYVLAGYANGGTILVNAIAATAFMAGAAAVAARAMPWNLSRLGGFLFLGLVGLLVMGLLQIFFPAFRGTQMELFISGGGVVLFALFTAYDMQRIAALGRFGANPFLLALSLYLDIFNLFLYVLRFMLVLSGNRR